MSVESVLTYGLAVLGGWLLRQWGIGAGIKMPGMSPPGAAASPATASATRHVPVLATLKADVDQIVKSAVEQAVKQAVDDIKAAAALQPPAKS